MTEKKKTEKELIEWLEKNKNRQISTTEKLVMEEIEQSRKSTKEIKRLAKLIKFEYDK